MSRYIVLACIFSLVFSSGLALAAEGYELLFKGTTSKLSRQEKQQIFKKLAFRLSKNKKFIVDETCGEDVSPSVEVVDLNGDGAEEVFVRWGNTCTSGLAGQSVSLFIKNSRGQFVGNLGFPGSCEILASPKEGFPDLMINGPGFCHGVWQWTGTTYEYKCSIEEEPRGCSRKGIQTICE